MCSYLLYISILHNYNSYCLNHINFVLVGSGDNTFYFQLGISMSLFIALVVMAIWVVLLLPCTFAINEVFHW